MSKVRGIGGLVLATVFGVANGITQRAPTKMPFYSQTAGVAVFGPAFKEQKQQSGDTNGKAETFSSPEDAVSSGEKIVETTTAIESAAESTLPRSPSKEQSFGLMWPSLSAKWSWKDFWREGDRAVEQAARTDSRQPDSQSISSIDQVKERGTIPDESLP
ncbi:hypothetical protein MMC30_001187 [Trapelia coarctata]|nr:hypothetical protein [Trapelia coarctata]